MKVRAETGALILVAGLLATSAPVAQEQPAHAEGEKAPSFRPSKDLNEQQKRGEHLFLQRCAICHQAKYRKSAAQSELPVFFRSLEGVLKNAEPAREDTVREYIRRGSMTMPGFQYTLESNEFDDLMTYLKTR